MRCGELAEAGDVFCGTCGQPLDGAAPAGDAGPAPTALVPDRLAAAGMGAANAQYVGRRLEYDKASEETFGTVANVRLASELALRTLLFLVLLAVGTLAWAAIIALLYAGTKSAELVVVMIIAGLLIGFVLVVLGCVMPMSVPLSDWKFLVDGAAPSAEATLAGIAWSLQRRQPPTDGFGVRRLQSKGRARNHLEIRHGHFTGVITCFGYGTDLFVSWTLWLSMSPLEFALQTVRSLGAAGRSVLGGLHAVLGLDTVAALREVVHSATREGVDSASGPATHEARQVLESLPVTVSDIDF